jgi:hypothetical protein
MQHGVIERVHPLEIIGIQHVLGANARGRFRAEIGLEQLQHGPNDRKAGDVDFLALALEPRHQVALEQREKHDPGLVLDLGEDAVELLLAAHQRIDMLDRGHIGVLRRDRARDGRQRFAGGIGDEVKVKVAGGFGRHWRLVDL